MEFTREIYWDVGHGVTTLLPMYLLTFVTIAILVNEFVKRIKVYKHGQPIHRLDQLPVRILNLDINLKETASANAWLVSLVSHSRKFREI